MADSKFERICAPCIKHFRITIFSLEGKHFCFFQFRFDVMFTHYDTETMFQSGCEVICIPVFPHEELFESKF
jgi:hypothetical protein